MNQMVAAMAAESPIRHPRRRDAGPRAPAAVCGSCWRVIAADAPERCRPRLAAIEAALAAGGMSPAGSPTSWAMCWSRGWRPLHGRAAQRAAALVRRVRARRRPSSARRSRAPRGRAYAGPLRHEWDEAAYARALRARARLHRGRRHLSGQSELPLALRLRRRSAGAVPAACATRAAAAHGAFIDDGERQILSLSPELFFDDRAGRRDHGASR